MASIPLAAESALDPTDPYEREAQTFPRLDTEMLSRIATHGARETVAAGAHLFHRDDHGVDFFVVLSGGLEIYDIDDCGRTRIIRVHQEGEFTGELDLFSDRPSLVNGRATVETCVIRVPRDHFRALIASEPDIGEIIMRAFILRRVGLMRHGQGGVTLVGPGHGGDMLRLQRFLLRNGYPHRILDTETDPDSAHFLERFGLGEQDLPVVIGTGRQIMRNPTNAALADSLGLSEELDPAAIHDVAVVGAGPAGLAAAVYAASEGLETIVIESMAPGGQAGTSSKIENYLGFPTGISGQALAGRAQVQAQKFGARLAISRAVTRLECEDSPFRLVLEDGECVAARAIVVATGARYSRLSVPDYERFEGQGIHYAATAMEAALCKGEEVVVVGGGNSAGQAAIYLSRFVAMVHIVVRGPGLSATMSSYLIDRIDASPRITLHPHAEITALEGDTILRSASWTDRRTGKVTTRPVGNLFVMIGAAPNTDWLEGCLDLDPRGFVQTGADPDGMALSSPYATSRPGVFAVGDVRSGSVKRVASGVGEGSVVVQAIHRYLNPES
jgi:thioredoxin reductase (NADPH)